MEISITQLRLRKISTAQFEFCLFRLIFLNITQSFNLQYVTGVFEKFFEWAESIQATTSKTVIRETTLTYAIAIMFVTSQTMLVVPVC
jgi:hypothetical protein